MHGGFLKPDQIPFGHPDVNAFIFAQSSARSRLVAGCFPLEIGDAFPFAPLDGVKKILLFFSTLI